MRLADRSTLFLMQEPAGHMKDRLGIEVTVSLPQLEKGDALGVPEQPGGFVIEGGGAFIQRAYPEGHVQPPAV